MICAVCNKRIRAGYVVINGENICTNCRDRAIQEEKSVPTLTICPVCKGKVSSAALACPHCGQPMNNRNTPRCPSCQSDNVRKIEAGEKAMSALMFGLFSGKIRKTMECENCGYRW